MFACDANISAESPGQLWAVRCINIVIISTQAGGEGEGGSARGSKHTTASK